MIKLVRVDHRLLHGQVAFTWTSAINADCILIANDAVPKDDLRKMSAEERYKFSVEHPDEYKAIYTK